MSNLTKDYHLNKLYEFESLMLHTKFLRIDSLVPGKKILSVYTIFSHGSHLGHVTIIMLMTFHFLVPKNLHTKFG